ncbi:MAG: amidohydrolase family protein [Xanthobacteraceae bacterium]|nr:amidohydrolase family protein [Xanthobacteraceae bacterium]
MSDPGITATRRAVLAAGASLTAAGAFAGRAAAQGDAELARVAGARRILLKGGVVLTLDRAVGDFARADVLIENGRIGAVRPDIAAGDAAVVDAANRIVMPGFIDSHHHFYQGILRNILSNGLLNPDYSRDISGALTVPYRPADVYAGTLVSALGMIDMGTTAAVDTSQVNHTPEHSDAGVRALQDSGLRVVYAYSRGAGPAAQYPQDLIRLQKAYFSSQDQLMTLALGGNLNVDQYTFARKHGVRMVAHGVRDETEKVLFELARLKLLGAGDEYIHCTHLSDAAWRLLKDTGSEVSLAVPIEMAMGHGMPPIQEAIDHGIRPSLSSDVGVTMAQDPFTVMRACFTLQRLNLLQRARRGEKSLPPLLTTREVLEFATVDGARCLGLAGKVGTLTPGKEADIVMLATDRLNVWPLNNVPGAVVNLMNPMNVDTVFIAGKVKKWRGGLVGVDVARVLKLVEEARDGVIARAGFKTSLFA